MMVLFKPVCSNLSHNINTLVEILQLNSAHVSKKFQLNYHNVTFQIN